MSAVVEMKEMDVGREFYDGLELLVVKYGAIVSLTVMASKSQRTQVEAELSKRGMQARWTTEHLIVHGG